MGLHSCLGGTTLQSLTLATIPTSSSSRCIFRTAYRTLTFNFLSRISYSQKPPLPHPIRALSTSAAVQTSPATSSSTIKTPDDKGGKAQWKAAIDFKWIRDNKEAVAANIKNRNSNANLELVLEHYEKMFNLQKQEVESVRGERNAVANKMKGKMEPSERQRLIEEGAPGEFYHPSDFALVFN